MVLVVSLRTQIGASGRGRGRKLIGWPRKPGPFCKTGNESQFPFPRFEVGTLVGISRGPIPGLRAETVLGGVGQDVRLLNWVQHRGWEICKEGGFSST